jgi:alginate O-acetyltransferase complex protein AlgI
MLFTSREFVVLLAIAFALYHARAAAGWQLAVLLLADLVFYAHHDPRLAPLLIASIALNATASYLTARGRPEIRRPAMVAGVAANLALLALFKYGPLGARTFFDEGSPAFRILLGIPLPIGISFYTFQGITLVVDAYRRADLVHERFAAHAVRTAFFIAFFPHMIAGPIVKAHDFLPQIGAKRLADIDWTAAFRALVTGYFLKVVVADNLADLTGLIDFPHHRTQSSATLAAMLFGYSMQIFADFAGYSLIAIGLARLFGYRLMENFDFPYVARSFAEFWRRWHISLSTFLRDYLFIPLGGSRAGRARTYVNLFVVMFLGGLWHGAAWSYAVWGTFHGVLLAVERLLSDRVPAPHGRVAAVARVGVVFGMVTLAWLLFRLPDHRHVVSFLGALAGNTGLAPDHDRIFDILLFSLPVLAYHAQSVRPPPAVIAPLVFGLMLFLIAMNPGPRTTFIYFQF